MAAWFLIACSITFQLYVSTPQVVIEGKYPTEQACKAADLGASEEGNMSLHCVEDRPVKIAVAIKECADKYVTAMTCSDFGCDER